MAILKLYDGSEWVEIPIYNAAHGPAKHTEGGNWKVPYTDGSGDEQELALSATGGILESKGASTPPVFTIPKRSIQIRAPGLIPNTTNPCADAVQTETGNGRNYLTRSFAANEQGTMDMELPPNYDGGTVTWWYKFVTPAGSSAGDTVIFGLAAGTTKDDESMNVALGARVNITYTLPNPTAAGDLAVSAESAALTIASSGTPAGGDHVTFEIERTGGDMAEEAPLLIFYVRYGTNNASDE